jgi:hypothetical protein
MERDDFEDQRSSFDRVVESVDAVIHRHPSLGRALRNGEQHAETSTSPHQLPDNVVDLRSRLTVARTGGLPDDAA